MAPGNFTPLFLLALWVPAAQGAEALKIGYVNVIQVMQKAPQASAADARIRTEFEPRDRELDTLRERARKLRSGLEKDRNVLGGEQLQTRERQLFELKRRVKRLTRELREDYDLRRTAELQGLRKLVEDAAVAIGREEQYDLVLEAVAIYASDRIDISDKVLKRISEK